MAVMTKMRENTKTILIILVFAFMATIVFSWGMGGIKCGPGLQLQQGVIAKVNGQKINLEDFDTALEDQVAAYRQRTGTDLEDYEVESLRSSVWDALIENELVAKELKFVATDDEIRYYIFEQPPEFLREQDLFKNDQGFFDQNNYQSALSNPQLSAYWMDVERLMRLYLPRQKLENALQMSAQVTDEEVQRYYLEQNQRAKVNYLFFDPARAGRSADEIPEDEIRAYYDAHKKDFLEPEKRKIDYVLFSTLASRVDTMEVQRLAADILQRVKEGEDFAELAEIYSEDPGSAERGGDLGFFDRETMLKPFSDAAFAANKGDIVGPIETMYGLHIIKIEDRKIENGEPQVKARHILLKYGPLQSTIENANYAATYFVDQLRDGEDFYELAASDTLAVQSTDYFPEGGFIPTIGRYPQAARFIFTGRVGTTSGSIRTSNGYMVFRIADIQKKHISDLENVRTQIKGILTTEKNKEISRQLCEEAYQKIQGGTPLYRVAEDDSLQVNESDYFTRSGYLPGVGRDPIFMGTAFGLEVGQISKPISGSRGYYLIELLQKDEFNQADFERQKLVLRNQLMQRKRDSMFREWLTNLKENAVIEDYRGYYGY